MNEVEKFVRDLDTKEVNVDFHRKVWPAENELLKRKDGKKQYGSHIIELSRKRDTKM